MKTANPSFALVFLEIESGCHRPKRGTILDSPCSIPTPDPAASSVQTVQVQQILVHRQASPACEQPHLTWCMMWPDMETGDAAVMAGCHPWSRNLLGTLVNCVDQNACWQNMNVLSSLYGKTTALLQCKQTTCENIFIIISTLIIMIFCLFDAEIYFIT